MINLLVTGGYGFIASNFINHIFDENIYNIINIDVMYYCANKLNVFENIKNSNNYTFINGNICDYNLILDTLYKYNINHIIHFAAQSHVDNSFKNSLQYTNDNIVGTHTLLECCRVYSKIEKFIHVSTDEVYGESMISEDENKKTEESALCPTNPYASSKAGAELMAKSYYHSFKMPIIITRGNNVYGRNQYPEKLIPRFIMLLKENKKLTIQGDGSNVRAFLHASDVAKAFKLILEKGEIGEVYNIGSDEHDEYTVMDIAKILIKKLKNNEKYEDYIEFIEDRPFNDKRYYISNDKLKNMGWTIDMNFENGLNDTVNYYLKEYKEVF